MDNPQATDAELGWLAGIIDGEGWLGFSLSQDQRDGRKQRMTVKCELKITNCDEAIIDKSIDILIKLGVNPYRRSHKQLSSVRRIVHECAIKHMTGIQKVLPPVLPYLVGIKLQRALIMLRFIELRKSNPGLVVTEYDANLRRQRPIKSRPYTDEEMALVDACRELQSRGASETTREARERTVKAFHKEVVQLRERVAA